MKLSAIRINQDKANQGVWAKFAGAEFLIARFNNKLADTLRTKLIVANLELVQSETPEGDAKQEEINVQILSETILLDWKGIEDDEGNPLPYSHEKAAELLSDESLVELRTFIQNFSFNRENYQTKAEAAVTDSVKATAAS